jgi:glycosyltransferase involved in cell wall biosynthesis
MRTSISVICTVKNEEETIEKLINSLIHQKLKPMEIIIVDGGSTDSTWKLISKISRKYKGLIKPYLKNGYNIAQGRNYAIRKSRGKLVASIDGGCYADKSWLEELYREWKRSKADVVSGVFKPWIENYWDEIEGYFQCPSIKRLSKDWNPSSRSVLFTKRIWRKVDGYPEDLYTAEDTIFNKKLREIGAKYSIAKNAVVYWRMRRNLYKIFVQFSRYAEGDVKARTYKEKKFILFLILVMSFIFVSLETFIRIRKLSIRHYFIGFFINCAKRFGYFYGFIKSFAKNYR